MSTVHAERPRIRPLRVAVSWFLSAAALLFAAWVVPGVAIELACRCSGERCATAARRRWRWLADGSYTLTELGTDLSSQTGASHSGILLGSNEDIPAFRRVEKESGLTMTCSKPADCAEIERRRSTGVGLLRNGGAKTASKTRSSTKVARSRS